MQDQGVKGNKVNSSLNGRWTKKEHQDFIEAIQKYGKNWKLVEKHVKTRSGTQIRSHAQKFFNRMERQLKKNKMKGDLFVSNGSEVSMDYSQPESQNNKVQFIMDQPVKKMHRNSMDDDLLTQNKSSYEILQNNQFVTNKNQNSSSFFNTIINQYGSDLFDGLYQMVQIDSQNINQSNMKERSISFIEYVNARIDTPSYRKQSLNEAMLNNQY